MKDSHNILELKLLNSRAEPKEHALALASLVASASAAMALCRFWGRRTSFTSTRSICNPWYQGLVKSEVAYVNSPGVCGCVNHGFQVLGNIFSVSK